MHPRDLIIVSKKSASEFCPQLAQFIGTEWLEKHEASREKSFRTLQGWVAYPPHFRALQNLESDMVLLKSKLPSQDFQKMIKNLKNDDQFLSARSEIALACRLVNLGFSSLRYEPEYPGKKHSIDLVVSQDGKVPVFIEVINPKGAFVEHEIIAALKKVLWQIGKVNYNFYVSVKVKTGIQTSLKVIEGAGTKELLTESETIAEKCLKWAKTHKAVEEEPVVIFQKTFLETIDVSRIKGLEKSSPSVWEEQYTVSVKKKTRDIPSLPIYIADGSGDVKNPEFMFRVLTERKAARKIIGQLSEYPNSILAMDLTGSGFDFQLGARRGYALTHAEKKISMPKGMAGIVFLERDWDESDLNLLSRINNPVFRGDMAVTEVFDRLADWKPINDATST